MVWDDTKVSKFLAFVLRHRPEEIGIELDSAGWVSVDELIAGCVAKGCPLTRARLDSIVKESDKQRFHFNDNQTKIRAAQGHSAQVDLELQPSEPPDVLYHGTASRFLASIEKQGLQKQGRQHVHLSTNIGTASSVGKRYGKPVVLTVDSRRMQDDGCLFFVSENGVWLTDHVPAEYITFPEVDRY